MLPFIILLIGFQSRPQPLASELLLDRIQDSWDFFVAGNGPETQMKFTTATGFEVVHILNRSYYSRTGDTLDIDIRCSRNSVDHFVEWTFPAAVRGWQRKTLSGTDLGDQVFCAFGESNTTSSPQGLEFTIGDYVVKMSLIQPKGFRPVDPWEEERQQEQELLECIGRNLSAKLLPYSEEFKQDSALLKAAFQPAVGLNMPGIKGNYDANHGLITFRSSTRMYTVAVGARLEGSFGPSPAHTAYLDKQGKLFISNELLNFVQKKINN